MRLAKLPQYTSDDIISLTKNDRATWDIFRNGYTCCINQCGSAATTERLMQYKPRCLEDLSAFVAAIRPGFQSQLSKFLAREKFSYGVPSFDVVLKNDTSNSSWLIYQENIMTCLSLAGFTKEETYPILKAVSKKKESVIEAAGDRFIKGFTAHIASTGVPESTAEEQSQIVWRVIRDSASYMFCAAHAVAVALDALYGAYLKAHHPLEYYTVLLDTYARKADKDMIALIKSEMQRAFGIRLVACRFRQDNRAFAFDSKNNTITDALRSVRNISQRVADALYDARDMQFASFTDVLHWMDNHPAFSSKSIYPLIHMGYFAEFGSTGKLLAVWDEFKNGESAYKKNLIQKSQNAKLVALRRIEAAMPESEVSPERQLMFETEYFGTPLAVFPQCRRMYTVLDVDDKYTPKLRLYTAANGKTGVAKIKKALYLSQIVKAGDIITVDKYSKRPAYQFSGGQRTVVPGIKEIWIEEYSVFHESAQQKCS